MYFVVALEQPCSTQMVYWAKNNVLS